MKESKKGFCTRYLLFLGVVLSSCTYSINMVHTEGSASDVVDETQTPSTSVQASVPVSAI